MSAYLISQILGYITTVITVISFQQKEMKAILALTLSANMISGASNLLLSGVSGSLVAGIAVLQTCCSYCYQRKQQKPPIMWTILFVAAFSAVGILTFQNFTDLLPSAAAILFSVGVMQERPFVYRLLLVGNALLWIAYELLLPVPNTALMVGFVLQLVSIVVAIARLDIKKKNGEEKL